MSIKQITIEIKVPWHAMVYLNTVAFIASVFNMGPNSDKVYDNFIGMVFFNMRLKYLWRRISKITKMH